MALVSWRVSKVLLEECEAPYVVAFPEGAVVLGFRKVHKLEGKGPISDRVMRPMVEWTYMERLPLPFPIGR